MFCLIVLLGIIANNYLHEASPEAYELYGDQLAAFGFPLTIQFVGTDMTEAVRYIGDVGFRMHHILWKNNDAWDESNTLFCHMLLVHR